MKKLYSTIFILLFAANLFAQLTLPSVQGVPFNKVVLTDQFWLPRIETNRTITIPVSFKKCEDTKRVENFVLATKHEGKFQTTFPFDDTDIYKIIEGASFSMTVHPDAKLSHYVDSLITIVQAAQEPDGYLYTARTINPKHPHDWSGPERWVRESDMSHELYNSGHLFEAAAAHYQATGKRNFLNIALKNADLLVNVFGEGKRNDAPGHEIVEMGLVRLYRITNEKKYLDLAQFFINCRGKKNDINRAYWQDHTPLVKQDEAVGHAVRASYLYSGVADVATLTNNKDYLNAIDKIWENMVSKKMYITGGIGSIHDGERFGNNYELPNLTAYNETCAAIANVYWNYRMFLLHADSKYIDVLERSLYNGVISGVGLDGKTFFYANPLESDGKFKFNQGSTTRQPWFDCSCCPTNLCRFLPSVAGYIYAQKENNVYVNLFIGSKANFPLDAKNKLEISQTSNYPWDGKINLNINPSKKTNFALYIRIPAWAKNQPVPSDLYSYLSASTEKPSMKVNGQLYGYKVENGYAVVKRDWKKGDVIEYVLPMNIRRVLANDNVPADKGKVAIERGPIVYCLEGVDNGGKLGGMILPDNTPLTSSYAADKLSGVQIISGEANFFTPSADGLTILSDKRKITAIPYFVWNNRGANEMKVWIARKISDLKLGGE